MAEVWGSSGPFSLPVARKTFDTAEVDMDGFVFTPEGIRVNLSEQDREEIIASSYRPPRRAGRDG